jgi:hypothetical protein
MARPIKETTVLFGSDAKRTGILYFGIRRKEFNL